MVYGGNDDKNTQQQELIELKQKLVDVTAQLETFREDLMERQTKINDQAIQCDELECQVEHMTIVCAEMMSSLKQLNDRNTDLEQELLDARNMLQHQQERKRGQLHPEMIHFQALKEGGSPMELTLSTADETTRRGDDNNSLDSTYTMSSASITAPPGEGQDSPKPSFAGFEEDHHHTNNNNSNKSMIETLMATIQVLDQENAELREEKYYFVEKCDTQQQEISRQMKIIRDLEWKLERLDKTTEAKYEVLDVEQSISSTSIVARDDEQQQGGEAKAKSSFFERFLSTPNAGK
jgi:hypothetical protein